MRTPLPTCSASLIKMRKQINDRLSRQWYTPRPTGSVRHHEWTSHTDSAGPEGATGLKALFLKEKTGRSTRCLVPRA